MLLLKIIQYRLQTDIIAHASNLCVFAMRLWLASEFCIKMVSASASVPRVFWRGAKIYRQGMNRFRDCREPLIVDVSFPCFKAQGLTATWVTLRGLAAGGGPMASRPIIGPKGVATVQVLPKVSRIQRIPCYLFMCSIFSARLSRREQQDPFLFDCLC
jgi:hypothetical protein